MRLSTKITAAAAALSAILCCQACGQTQEAKVMARYVPERCDDFIFENDLIAGRIYGEALESCGKGQITSPGIDVWVKTPGALVADQRYKDELEHGKSYHKDWGNGKDCYKVGRSLGAGASCPLVGGVLCLPETNYRSWSVEEQTSDKVVFTLDYPEWTLPDGVTVSLSKKLTVTPGTYFVACEDTYSFTGAETLTIAAGVNRHEGQGTFISENFTPCSYAIWEHASDQSVEPEDGLIGVAVVMPGADSVCYTPDNKHAICCKTIRPGQSVSYSFGSCWSKADIKTEEVWFETVAKEQ